MEITKVYSSKDVEDVARVANIVWSEHYTPIIGVEQVEYMIDKFQSSTAILQQIKENNYEYFLLKENEQSIGYIGLQVQGSQLFLSKIYMQKSFRGKGFGKSSFDFIEKYACEHGCTEIYLTVNKNNHNSIAVYEKSGFKKTNEAVANIGNGYVMDDYIMTKMVL